MSPGICGEGGRGWQALGDKSHHVPVLSEREMSSVSVLCVGVGGLGLRSRCHD